MYQVIPEKIPIVPIARKSSFSEKGFWILENNVKKGNVPIVIEKFQEYGLKNLLLKTIRMIFEGKKKLQPSIGKELQAD